jgi:hypothetical protein
MSKATEIVKDVEAFVRSTVTTLIALTVTVSGICAALVALDVLPDGITVKVVAAGTLATALGTSLRQVIAWFDKGNTSFGHVAVEVDPGAHLPGDAEPEDITPEELALIEGPEPEPNEPDLSEEDIDGPVDGPQEGGN